MNEVSPAPGGHDPWLRLRRAVAEDDLDAAARALAEGADPERGSGGTWLLGQVAFEGSAAMAELLLATGADPNRRTPEGWTALTIADSWDNDAVAGALEARGVDPGQRLLHGFTPLHRAARRGDLAAVDALVAVSTVDALDSAGDTALLEAIGRGHEAVVDALLAAGADPDLHGGDWSPLTEAAYQDSLGHGSGGLVAVLLAAGADPNPCGVPPALGAVTQSGARVDVLTELWAAGADVDSRDPANGETILHLTAQIGVGSAVVDAALAAGAQLEVRDDRGRTPLHWAAAVANVEVAAALLAAGADTTAVDHDGATAVDLVGSDNTIPPDRVAVVERLLRSPDIV